MDHHQSAFVFIAITLVIGAATHCATEIAAEDAAAVVKAVTGVGTFNLCTVLHWLQKDEIFSAVGTYAIETQTAAEPFELRKGLYDRFEFGALQGQIKDIGFESFERGRQASRRAVAGCRARITLELNYPSFREEGRP